MRMHRQLVVLAALAGTAAAVAAAPIASSTLGWAVHGTVSEVARAGDVAYLGGSFDSVAPAANKVPGFAVFSADSAMPVLPGLDINGRVRAVVALPAGGWIIGGEFSQVNGQARSRLARIAADGTLAPAFAPQVGGGNVLALAALGGTVYVGGDFLTVSASMREGLAAIDAATGAVLPAFAPGLDGGSSRATVSALVAAAGVVYAGGFFESANGTARSNLAALDPVSGAVLPAFTGTADAAVLALAHTGSALYAAGNFDSIGGAARKGVARLDPATGLAVAAFNAQSDDDVVTLAVAGGGVFVGGGFNNIGGAPRRYLARLDAATGLAAAWNPSLDGEVKQLAAFGAALIAAGDFHEIGGKERLNLAALDVASGAALPWNPALNDGADLVHVDAGGLVFVGGDFTHFGAVLRENLAAVDLRSGALLSWNPGANGWVRALDVVGNTVYIGGDFWRIGGVERQHLAALDVVTGAVAPWTAEPNGPVYGLAVADDVVYFVGSFAGVKGGAARGNGAAVGVDGVVRPWNPAADAAIEALAVAGARVYVGGEFMMLGVQGHPRLGAVDATTGAAVPAFAASVGGPVYRVDVQNDLVFVGGGFSMVNGATRHNAAALKHAPGAADDGQLQGWNPDVGGPVYDLDAFGADVYLAGGFGSVAGSSRPGIAVVDALAGGGALRAWTPADVSGGYISVIDTSATAVLFGGLLYDQDGVSVGAVLYPETGLPGTSPPPTTPTMLVRGATLDLRWGAPPLGARPTGYVIEAGTAPGLRNLASFNTGSMSTSFNASGLGPGTYYVRLRSANAFGIGASSADQAFVVGAAGCTGPPRAPVDVTAAVAGSTVRIDWRDSPQSIATGYRLIAGVTSGGSQVGAFDVGGATTFSAAAPPGAYFLRVVATNPCGVSAPSDEAVAVVGSPVVPAGPPFGLEYSVAGSVVTFAWGAPSVGTGPFQYRLEAGSATGLSNLANALVASPAMIVPGVPPGVYYVRVRAVGPAGTGPASNEVVVVVP
jgi:hypothetical protein